MLQKEIKALLEPRRVGRRKYEEKRKAEAYITKRVRIHESGHLGIVTEDLPKGWHLIRHEHDGSVVKIRTGKFTIVPLSLTTTTPANLCQKVSCKRRRRGEGEEDDEKQEKKFNKKNKTKSEIKAESNDLKQELVETKQVLDNTLRDVATKMRIIHVDLARLPMTLHGCPAPKDLIQQYQYQVIRGRLNVLTLVPDGVEGLGRGLGVSAAMVDFHYNEQTALIPKEQLRDMISNLRKECGQTFQACANYLTLPITPTTRWLGEAAQKISPNDSFAVRSYFWSALQIYWAVRLNDQALTVLSQWDGLHADAFMIVPSPPKQSATPRILVPAIVCGEEILCMGEATGIVH